MRYTKPQLEIVELETSDVILASSEGSMTVGEVTITGPQDEFAYDFGDLVGIF